MAVTETTPTVATRVPANPWDMGDAVPAGAQVLGSGDHRTLGSIWIGFSLLFGLVSAVLAGLTALDGVGDLTVVPTDGSFRAFTASEIGLVLLFAVPLFLGLATYLVPLQVRANTIAFPRAASAALWTWLLGAVLVVVSYAIDGGVGGVRYVGVDLTYLGLALVIAALVLGSVCVLTTVVALRTEGMTLDRVPAFSWSMFVAGTIWVLTLPVLAGNLLLIYVDQHYGAPVEFGLPSLQWGQLSWAFQAPQVFAYAIGALGIVTDVLLKATASPGDEEGAGSGPRHGALLAAIGAFGILSFGAWAQPAFNEDVTSQALYVGMGVAILLPILALVGGWADIARKGAVPKPSIGLALALGAVLALLLAGASSVLSVVGPMRLAETPTLGSAVVAFVLVAATLAGLAGVSQRKAIAS